MANKFKNYKNEEYIYLMSTKNYTTQTENVL